MNVIVVGSFVVLRLLASTMDSLLVSRTLSAHTLSRLVIVSPRLVSAAITVPRNTLASGLSLLVNYVSICLVHLRGAQGDPTLHCLDTAALPDWATCVSHKLLLPCGQQVFFGSVLRLWPLFFFGRSLGLFVVTNRRGNANALHHWYRQVSKQARASDMTVCSVCHSCVCPAPVEVVACDHRDGRDTVETNRVIHGTLDAVTCV